MVKHEALIAPQLFPCIQTIIPLVQCLFSSHNYSRRFHFYCFVFVCISIQEAKTPRIKFILKHFGATSKCRRKGHAWMKYDAGLLLHFSMLQNHRVERIYANWVSSNKYNFTQQHSITHVLHEISCCCIELQHIFIGLQWNVPGRSKVFQGERSKTSK